MNKKPQLIKCPRCELNYIDKKAKLCNICKAELNMPISFYSSSEDDEDAVMELCPKCKINYINFDEDMCAVCRAEKEREGLVLNTDDDEEEWRSFLDDDVDAELQDGLEVSLSQLEEEELEDEDEDEYFSEIIDADDILADEYLDEYDDTEDEDEDYEYDEDDE